MQFRGNYKIITPPASEPIDLQTAKDWCKVDYSDDDDIFTALIQSAREYAEHETRRALFTQTLQMALPCFPVADSRNPMGFIKLFRSPVQTLKKIEYYDTDNVLTTLYDADADPAVTNTAILDNWHEPARVTPAVGTSWPSTAMRPDAVRITFVAGYSATTDIPAGIKLGMRHLIAYGYQNRMDSIGEKLTAADLCFHREKVPEI